MTRWGKARKNFRRKNPRFFLRETIEENIDVPPRGHVSSRRSPAVGWDAPSNTVPLDLIDEPGAVAGMENWYSMEAGHGPDKTFFAIEGHGPEDRVLRYRVKGFGAAPGYPRKFPAFLREWEQIYPSQNPPGYAKHEEAQAARIKKRLAQDLQGESR